MRRKCCKDKLINIRMSKLMHFGKYSIFKLESLKFSQRKVEIKKTDD